MNTFLYNIKDIKKLSLQFGAKASNAGILNHLGYTIPQGFCIATHCFKEFCQFNGIDEAEERNTLQEKILNGKFPDEIRLALDKEWGNLNPLGEKAFIIRSSSASEDGAINSFAGIYESIINIRDYTNLEKGIKACWGSYYSQKAIDYRNDRQLIDYGMAILVQEMIEGEKSGILFTINPINNDTEQIILEAYPGLNFAVADGVVPADCYVLDRNGISISERIEVKRFYYKLGITSNSIDTSLIDKSQWLSSTLNPEDIKELVKTALRIEKDYKMACDIEWTIKNNKVYILQVRPISSNGKGIEGNNYNAYDLDISEEVECSLLDRYSEPASCCYLSLLEGWSQEVYLDFYSKNEGKYSTQKPLLFYFNRVYWNHKYQREYYDDIPFGTKGYRAILKKLKLIHLMFTGYRSWYKRLDNYKEEISNYRRLPIKEMSLDELVQLLEGVINYFCNYIGKDHYQFLGLAQVCYKLLVKKLELNENYKEIINAALKNNDYENMTMKANLQLETLAKEAYNCHEVKEIFSKYPADIIENKLEEGSSFCNNFKEKLKYFINEHGHRGISCDDLLTPHWEEEPGNVYDTIKQLINNGSERIFHSPVHEENNATKVDLSSIIISNIGIGKYYEKIIINKLIKLTSEYMTLRENQRYYFDMSWVVVRKILLEIGARMTQRNQLEGREDIFHLKIDEIASLIRTREGIELDYKPIVKQRIKVYQKNKKITPPYYIKQGNIVPMQKKGYRKSYKAIGISAGVAIGPVRIISTIKDLSKIRQGDIVVVANFHPSWTPILNIVSGMVMSYGNILSHGAVIAREYRIPVVVFNDAATEAFTDNQWIEIDGTTGRIRVPNTKNKWELSQEENVICYE